MEQLLNEREAGKLLRISMQLLRKWRGSGTGPAYIKLGKCIRYSVDDLKEATRLLQEQTRNKNVEFENFDLYSLRHTCLTRWAPHMDPWTLMRLAGHSDMATTKRYIHPEDEATRQAMQRARDAVDLRAQEALDRARKATEGAQSRDSAGDDLESICSEGRPN